LKFTESMLMNYSQPLSATEDGQCKNAIRMVADALKILGFTDDNAAITPLYTDTFAYSLQMRRSSDSRNIKLFVQGSYANNTNVRTESDVDVAVIQEETFLPEYRKDSAYPQSGADYGFTPAPAAAKTFKDEVQEALKCKFGTDVERKNKSIKVHGNTYRKDADTVPCRRYRDYRQDYRRDASNFVGGVVIYPDNGGMIINYPEQHIANGRKKNNDTNHHYKKMVRIMKKMRYLMEDSYITAYSSAAKNVSSFMLESLLWNIEDSWYLKYCGDYRKVFAFSQLIATLQNRKNDFWGYKEANGIKELCPKPSDYTNLCNFIDQLASFYEYE
jgi:hypothetical protein